MLTVDEFKAIFKSKAEARNKKIRWDKSKYPWLSQTSLHKVNEAVNAMDDPPSIEQIEAVQVAIENVPTKERTKYKDALNTLKKQLPLLHPDFPGRVRQTLEYEGKFAEDERKKLVGLKPQPGLDGLDQVDINAPDDLEPDKLSALKDGFDLVKSLGFRVPPMKVHFAQRDTEETKFSMTAKVRNVAFMKSGDTKEGEELHDEINLFLSGDKLLAHSVKKPDTDGKPYRGGMTDNRVDDAPGRQRQGARGVPDQAADAAAEGVTPPAEAIRRANKAYATAIVAHEMGHILHRKNSSELFWAMKTQEDAFMGWRDLAMEVSEYACTNPMEFVAEVFTGREKEV